MLASPQSAERLALDWLDVARYSDTNGYSIDDHRDMWGWRDWVIHAFMENKPYDEFITEQLAGDLIPNATPLQKMATGFLRNSMNTKEGGTIAEEYRVAYIADKIDTVSSTFMGLTMKCTQCHDHKYDPINQEDYYRFYAFFDSATEHGIGATNGNTAPFIQVKSPLHEISGIEGSLKQRAARIRQLRNHLIHAEPGKYDAWNAGILAKATTPVNKPADKNSDFMFPPAGQAPNWIWADKDSATGRSVYSQGGLNAGRDHHGRCFSMWMAGGGVAAGRMHGETDDFCYNIVKDPVHIRDLNATIFHTLGIDDKRFSFKFQGLQPHPDRRGTEQGREGNPSVTKSGTDQARTSLMTWPTILCRPDATSQF